MTGRQLRGVALSNFIIKLVVELCFATHHHELTELKNSLANFACFTVEIKEWNDKVIPGTTDKSYGVHVAKIAGVPKEVITRANSLLEEFEKRDKEIVWF